MGKQKQKVQPKSTIIQDVVRQPIRVVTPAKKRFAIRFPKVPKPSRRFLFVALILTGAIGTGAIGYLYFKSSSDKSTSLSAFAQPIDERLTIPVYYPQNLPTGYVYNNDAKILSTNYYYYSVTSPNKQVFHVNQRPIPANFDFAAFNRKLLTPDTFNATSGTVTAGEAGASTVGSIKTNKNTWIIINSSAPNSVTQLETVARSLAPAR